MNIAQLLGELESAVSQAKTAGNRVQKAIEELKSVFGSLGVESVHVVGPTIPLDELETEIARDETKYVCPYCLKEFPPYRKPHRDSPHMPNRFRVVRHIANIRGRGKRHDHGAKKDPIPW